MSAVIERKSPVIDHHYAFVSAVVVDAGGAGLRAGAKTSSFPSRNRMHQKATPDPKPHRRRPGRSSRGALRNGMEDAYQRRVHNTIKGSEWFGDQDEALTAVPRVGGLKNDLPAHQRTQDLPKSHWRPVPTILENAG